jgi:hypothetical protein
MTCGGILLTLTACGSAKKADPAPVTAGTSAAGATGAAGAPQGGWPQGDNGVLDEKMCAILTHEDFQKFHMITGKPEASDFAPENKRIGVSCNYSLDDTLDLALFPTPAAAQALYGKFSGFKGATAATVTGADESIFGPDPSLQGAYRFASHRGKLFIYVNLSPTVNHLSLDQARTAAVGMAEAVLSRAPNLGR